MKIKKILFIALFCPIGLEVYYSNFFIYSLFKKKKNEHGGNEQTQPSTVKRNKRKIKTKKMSTTIPLWQC